MPEDKNSAVKISCVIPTYDRKELLKEALASVFKQRICPYEIIVVNNGQHELGLPPEIGSRVTIHNIEARAGASRARNFGARQASGDYLAFLDDDDLWGDERYLSRALEKIRGGAKCLVCPLFKKNNGSLKPYKNPAGQLEIKKILAFNPGVIGSNIIIEKKLFFEIGGFDEKLPTSEDKSLIIEVLKSGNETKTVEDNFVVYRTHGAKRLSDAAGLISGISAFIKKYRLLMDKETLFFNYYKIYKYKFLSDNYLAAIPMIFFRALKFFFRVINRWKKK